MSKAKYPKKIKIGHLKYDVEMVNDLRDSQDNKLLGMHYGNDIKIALAREMQFNQQQLDETLLHECLHSLWDLSNLPQEYEEHMVTCLAKSIIMLLRDNPKFAEQLING